MSTLDTNPQVATWPEPIGPEPDQPAPIYPSVGVSTLVSRSWNLMRQTLKPSFVVMLGPALLDALNGVLLTIPAILPTLSNHSGVIALSAIGALLAGMALGMVTFFVRLVALAGLSRLYYGALIQGRVMPIKEAFAPVLQHLLPLLLFSVLVSLLFMAFVVVDAIVVGIGIFGVYMLILLVGIVGAMLFAGAGGSVNPIATGAASVLVILLFVVLGVLLGLSFWGLISCQMVVCFMPLVAVANQLGGKQPLFAAFSDGLALSMRQFPRTVIFGFLQFTLVWVLSLALSLPVQVWYFLEVFFQAKNDPGAAIPIHVALITNVYSVVVGAMLWPLVFAGVTVFWYDCRARLDGLDLRIRLFHMAYRLLSQRSANKQPSV